MTAATPPTLETERLLLRPFEQSDAKDVQQLAGDRAIADTTMNIPHPYEDGVAEEWISKEQEGFNKGKGVTFAITRKADGRLVGAISLMAVDRGHSRAELGFWIGKSSWNKGFCTEAGHAVLRYALEVLGLNRIYAHHFSRNPASGRVMLKLGMKHEGQQRQHVRKSGRFEDIELYGILADDWRQRAE